MCKFIFSILCYLLCGNISSQISIGIPQPAWLDSSVIYEVNMRQFTESGSFLDFKKHLPRLQKMGVNILWFMPIYPISKIKRKGSLGSYYAVASYVEVNYEFGNPEDFRSVVKEAHKLGMKVILDWVPNHTGWSHQWIYSHPEYYTKHLVTDTIVHPLNTDWYDVADLDYKNPAMRLNMIKAILYWLDAYEIDGFRFDMAMMVPDDFWIQLNRVLKSMNKSIFLLAESEESAHRNQGIFHADFGWTFQNLIREIAKGNKNALDLIQYFDDDSIKFKLGSHLYFTSNHDENSWQGTEFELLGNAHQLFSALTFVLNGIPLIYNGQEEPIKKRLRFFEKDTIGFRNLAYESFYKNLIDLRKNNPALYSGARGGKMEWIEHTSNQSVLSFKRSLGQNEILCFFNLSNRKQSIKIVNPILNSKYREYNTDRIAKLKAGTSIQLNPWEFKIYIKK
ncbi:MAG: alpha-amylase family glycosyl hydrolase [Saprospiraceae bacterium]